MGDSQTAQPAHRLIGFSPFFPLLNNVVGAWERSLLESFDLLISLHLAERILFESKGDLQIRAIHSCHSLSQSLQLQIPIELMRSLACLVVFYQIENLVISPTYPRLIAHGCFDVNSPG